MMRFSDITQFFSRNIKAFLVLLLFLTIVTAVFVRFDFSGDAEGIYLYRGSGLRLFEVTDDLYLGDETRLIARFEFHWLSEFIRPEGHHPRQNDLHCDWHERTGRGYVLSHLPNGTKLLTCFSRFRDSNGVVPKGLFVGGGLPVSRHEEMEVSMNETGMAYYDGKEWQHLWCSVNEAIASTRNRGVLLTPSRWTFLGSRGT